MESEENWWTKVKEQSKKHLYLILAVSLFLVSALIGLSFLSKTEAPPTTFYPITNERQLKPILKMFSQKQYMNLTSYVDRILRNRQGRQRLLPLFYKAESYFLQKKYGEAWQIFFSLSRLYPNFWQARFRLGSVHLEKNELKDAEKYLLPIQAKNPEVLYAKAQLFDKQNKTKKAITFYAQVLTIPGALARIADLLYDSNDYKQALKYYTLLYDKHPQYQKSVFLKMVDIFERQKKYNKILAIIQDYDKNHAPTLEGQRILGKTFYYLGRKKEALKALNTPLLYRKNPEILRILSKLTFELKKYRLNLKFLNQLKQSPAEKKQYIITLMKLKEYSSAIEKIHHYLSLKAVKSPVERAEIYRLMVECHMQLEELDNALKYAMELVKYEETADNYILLSQIYKQLDNKAGYINSLKLATEKKPGYIPLLLKTLVESSSYDEAKLVISKIIKKDPYNEHALFYRAKLELKEKRLDHARISLFTLVHLPPKDKKIYRDSLYALGKLLLYQRKANQAQLMFEKALKLAPQAVNPALELSKIYIMKNRKAEAEKILFHLKSRSGLSSNVVSDIYGLLSYMARSARKIEKAKYYADRSLELNPKNSLTQKVLQSME